MGGSGGGTRLGGEFGTSARDGNEARSGGSELSRKAVIAGSNSWRSAVGSGKLCSWSDCSIILFAFLVAFLILSLFVLMSFRD